MEAGNAQITQRFLIFKTICCCVENGLLREQGEESEGWGRPRGGGQWLEEGRNSRGRQDLGM